MKKISILELEQLVREGNRVSDIARKLGVSKGAVSKRLKSLNVAITREASMHHAPAVVEQRIDAMAQLEKINRVIEGELDQIQNELGNATGSERRELQEIQIKHSAEIRKQLGLQLELFRAWYDVKAISEFQIEVLNSIREAAPDVRARILSKLQEKRALWSILDLSR